MRNPAIFLRTSAECPVCPSSESGAEVEQLQRGLQFAARIRGEDVALKKGFDRQIGVRQVQQGFVKSLGHPATPLSRQ